MARAWHWPGRENSGNWPGQTRVYLLPEDSRQFTERYFAFIQSLVFHVETMIADVNAKAPDWCLASVIAGLNLSVDCRLVHSVSLSVYFAPLARGLTT